MAKNEAKIKFTAETGDFNKQIQKSNSEMSELRAEMSLNETQMKGTGATVEGLEKKHSILEQQLKASESKTEALNQKHQKAVEIFGENSQEASKLKIQLLNAQNAEEKLRQAVSKCESELSDLKAELKDNKKGLDSTESSTEDLDESLDKVANSTDDATEGFTVMKGAMADLVADGIEGVISGFSEISKSAFVMTNDIDKATNSFIAKTGESAEEAEKFEDVMVNIYNGNYGESFEDIADSLAIVKTTMGDIGTDELENLTTKAIVLRDTFDMDVNESMRGVNALVKQFGLTGDQAFDLIAQGAQNGLNQNGDLLDIVNEYSVQFKNAGYSAEDMFNMLANGVDVGTWSVDKLGDAVKEFVIRASDGTVSEAIKENAKAFGLTKKEAENLATEVENGSVGAYKKLAETLRGIDDDTQRYQLGVSLFGTMWEDLGEDAVLAMLDTQGEISLTKDALDEINEVKYDDLGSALEGIKRNLETSVAEPIQNNVLPVVNEFVEDVDWQSVGQTVGEVFSTVVENALAFVDAISQAVKWMQEHKGVAIALAAVIGTVATAINLLTFAKTVKAALDKAEVTTIWQLVAAHWAQASAGMAALAPYLIAVAIIAAVIAIIVLLIKYWDEVVAAVKRCWEAVCETLSGWGDWIYQNVIQPIIDFFKGLWDGIVNIFKSIVDWVETNWKSIVIFLVNPFYGVFNYLYTNFEGFRNFIDNIVQSVKNFFVDMWNGIKSCVDSVVNWVKNAWESIKNATSTVFNAVKNTVSNIWNGIRTAISNVVNGVKNTVSNVFNGVKSTVSNVFNGIRSTAASVWNRIKTAITNPIEAAKNKIKGIIDKIKGFFSGMNLSLPKIKLPHFKITGKLSLDPPSIPKLTIDWYKDGGIFVKPTIFSTATGLKGVGEAGAEAVLPIDKLEGYISGAIEKAQTVVNFDSLAAAIEDLANRPYVFRVGDRDIAIATASANDSVNGLRSTFKGRGLALD